LLITPGAVYTPEELQARLGPESALVAWQQAPPTWSPPKDVQTPLLWLAGERDAAVGKSGARRSAAFYEARFVLVDRAGHDLMIEHNYRRTAETVHGWLVEQGIA
jgi:pimeloyl-ACP methyl ester carboxylesterase